MYFYFIMKLRVNPLSTNRPTSLSRTEEMGPRPYMLNTQSINQRSSQSHTRIRRTRKIIRYSIHIHI